MAGAIVRCVDEFVDVWVANGEDSGVGKGRGFQDLRGGNVVGR